MPSDISNPSPGGPGTAARALTCALGTAAWAACLFALRVDRLTDAPAVWALPRVALPVPPLVLLLLAAAAAAPLLLDLLVPRLRPGRLALAFLGAHLALLAAGPLPWPPALLRQTGELLQAPGLRSAVARAFVEAFVAGAVLAGACAVLLRADRSGPAAAGERAHGTARWATRRDLAAADLLSGEGTVLGRVPSLLGDRPLTDRSSDHLLVLMTTGGGKTSGPMASTLLNTAYPALVIDPKGELWNLTAGFRAEQGHRLVRFAPTTKDTCRWNPLAEIEPGDGEIAAIESLAANLVSLPAESFGASHWVSRARSLLRCLVLHSLYTDKPPSLTKARDLLSSRDDDLKKLFQVLATAVHDRDKKRGWEDPVSRETTQTHPEVGRLARAFAATPERERGSIVSTLNGFLDLWGDPAVSAATSWSDWGLADLLDPKRPTTVYVTVPTQHLARMAPLIRALLALLTHRVTRDSDKTYRDHAVSSQRPPLLLVLDEFAALGRVPILEDVLAFFRGYGVRALLAVQDLAQLRRLYGPHHTFSATCRLHLASATADVATRQEISRRLGDSTFVYRRVSRSGPAPTSRRTTSRAEVRRPLMTEGEIGTLPADQVLVVKAGHPPVLARRLAYWQHPVLARRAALKAPQDPVKTLREERQAKRPADSRKVAS